MDLAEVVDQILLVGDLDDPDQPVPLQGDQPICLVAEQEQVAAEQGQERAGLPAAGRAVLADDLGEVEGDLASPEVPGGRLLLARLGVQAVPAPLRVARVGDPLPEVSGNMSGSVGKIGMEKSRLAGPSPSG